MAGRRYSAGADGNDHYFVRLGFRRQRSDSDQSLLDRRKRHEPLNRRPHKSQASERSILTVATSPARKGRRVAAWAAAGNQLRTSHLTDVRVGGRGRSC